MMPDFCEHCPNYQERVPDWMRRNPANMQGYCGEMNKFFREKNCADSRGPKGEPPDWCPRTEDREDG